MSDNCDYCDNRDYHLYEIDRDNPWSFDESRYAKHFVKQEGRFACFVVFQKGQGAIEGTESRRGGLGQMVIERKITVEETEGSRADRGNREDRGL